MAAIPGFDANEQDEMRNFDALPEGKYLVAIVESEMKDTKSGTGTGINFTFQVIEGQYKGSNLFAWVNMTNPSEKCVAIGKAELGAICKAVNVIRPNDTIELHDLPLAVSVKQEVNEQNGKVGNRISGYYKKSWLQESKTPPAQAQHSQQPLAAGVGTAPWKRS